MSEIREDSKVTVQETGTPGMVLFITGDEAVVLFDGGFTGMVPLSGLKLAEEAP